MHYCNCFNHVLIVCLRVNELLSNIFLQYKIDKLKSFIPFFSLLLPGNELWESVKAIYADFFSPTGVNAMPKKVSRNMEKLQLPAELNETFGQNLPCPHLGG